MIFKHSLNRAIYKWRARRNRDVGQRLRAALNHCADEIPCFIVCYNNASHVEQMVVQLNQMGVTPIVFDNASTCEQTQSLLKAMHQQRAYVLRIGHNLRHKVGFLPGIFEHMPAVFAYTDPDLQFSQALPSHFLQTLRDLSREYGVFKAGSALTLNPDEINRNLTISKCKSGSMPYQKAFSVIDWESKYWKFQLQRSDDLTVYAAPLDTTFAVYNKANYSGSFMDAVRVAGDYAAIHLPWYPGLDNMEAADRARYLKRNKSSTWIDN